MQEGDYLTLLSDSEQPLTHRLVTVLDAYSHLYFLQNTLLLPQLAENDETHEPLGSLGGSS